MFSAANLHSTVPNTAGLSRYSIDFRTVNMDDVKTKGGAPNIDSACTGTSLRDFMRARDLERMPEEVAALYDTGDQARHGEVVFRPELAGATK